METTTGLPFRAAVGLSYGDRVDHVHRLDVLAPEVAADRRLPVVIRFECPGWKPGSRSAAFAGFSNPLLAGRGFITVAASLRSSDEASWPAQLGDAGQVLDWVLRNPLGLPIDQDRIGIWGHSAGGHVATMVTLAKPERIGATVAISTPFDLADSSWKLAHTADSPVSDLFGGPLSATARRRRDASPIHNLAAHNLPADQRLKIMIIHGTRDETVPFSQSVRMHAALRETTATTQLLVITGGHHNLRDDPEAGYDAPIWYDVGQQAADFLSSALAR